MPLSAAQAAQREQLLDLLRSYGSCLVAYSGGVDSAVAAKAAHVALGDQAVAATGVSHSLASGELEEAQRTAAAIGIRHVALRTEEFSNPQYLGNPSNRCFFCKTELYTRLAPLAEELNLAVIVNGANLDDRGDYRPGMQAAADHHVRSPLLECGLTKSDVRALAEDWSLPVWDKPASPCLSSRVAYGEAVTPERLARIDAAERYLRGLGLAEVRVRWHGGDLARLEVPISALPRLVEPAVRSELLTKLTELGFKFVTLDLAGFRSGSLNALLTEAPSSLVTLR